jgi:hypothetical protein
MLGNMMRLSHDRHILAIKLTALAWGILLWAGPVASGVDALDYLNSLREQAGMTPLMNDSGLARSAQNHADYLERHLKGDVSRMSSAHDESPAREGYTGRTPQERVETAGYPHKQVKENVAIGHATPSESIDGLMAAIYHRLAFLDFTIDQVGIGAAGKTDVFVMGRSDLQATCYQRPADALPDPPVDCGGVTVTRSFMEQLCDSVPASALFQSPWPEACPNGIRLRSDYMERFCAQPPAGALHGRGGEYFLLCNGQRRIRADWMRSFCDTPPPGAEYSFSGKHYQMCEPEKKIAAEWLESRCQDAPEDARYSDSGVYYEMCVLPFKLRADYLDTLDRRQQLLQPNLVVWPPDKSTGISPVFYEEVPDPLPDYSVSGYPLSVEVNPRVSGEVALKAFRLYREEEGGRVPVENTRLLDAQSDPNKRLSDRQFVLFPLDRLEWNTRYHAEVVLSLGGSIFEKRWSFTTSSTPAPLIQIGRLTQNLLLPMNREVVIYYPPTEHEPYTLEKVVSFHGTGIELDFEGLDYNTARVRFSGSECSDIEWRFADGKRINIELEGC